MALLREGYDRGFEDHKFGLLALNVMSKLPTIEQPELWSDEELEKLKRDHPEFSYAVEVEKQYRDNEMSLTFKSVSYISRYERLDHHILKREQQKLLASETDEPDKLTSKSDEPKY